MREITIKHISISWYVGIHTIDTRISVYREEDKFYETVKEAKRALEDLRLLNT